MSEMNWRSQEGSGEEHHVPFQAKMTGPWGAASMLWTAEDPMCYYYG